MCDVDNYYNTISHNGGCGYQGANYSNCNDGLNPGCCPSGFHVDPNDNVSDATNCSRVGVGDSGGQFRCIPNQPNMDNTSKLNCCMNTLPWGQSPNGYCASGYCQNSATCKSFLNNYCNNPANVSSSACIQYCNSDEAQAVGACDASITSYCNSPLHAGEEVCGCALLRNTSNYPGYGSTTPNIPVQCYTKCQASGAIRTTSTKSSCNIGAITVCNINNVDFTAINSSIGGGVTLSQNCSSNNGGGNNNENGSSSSTTTTNTFEKVLKNKWTWIICGAVLLLLIGLFAFFMTHSGDDSDEDNIESINDINEEVNDIDSDALDQ